MIRALHLYMWCNARITKNRIHSGTDVRKSLRNKDIYIEKANFPAISLEVAGIFVSLQAKKRLVMKDEKKKSHISEEECFGMAAEPVGAAMHNDVSSMGYNIDNWPGMPLVGPDNIDEMNSRIDQAEQEMDNGNGFSWDQVMLDAQSIVNRYATTVY